ncbi:MAG: glycerophosphodiester phosphodiesterase [Chitinophagaceae bacterium]|nr:MAG: glycerophosphodiester phosphodiesterase [Chitinophagaceae bacterium]
MPDKIKNYPSFLKEGHRGARGYVPENTIASMKKGIDQGANVIEVDVYITRDGQVLIAHDPYVNRAISTIPGVNDISADSAKSYTWHQMNYADIRKIDVGLKGNPAFPQQVKQPAYMPLLGELIDSVEAYTLKVRKPVIYNIEIKSNPKFDGIYQPDAATIVRSVMEVVKSKNIGERFYLQSFDKRQIQEAHKSYPAVVTAYLVDSKTMTVDAHIQELGYTPEIYSPHYKLVTAQTVADCKKHKMQLVPWTVNTKQEIDALMALGVNGIITDYPDLVPNAR